MRRVTDGRIILLIMREAGKMKTGCISVFSLEIGRLLFLVFFFGFELLGTYFFLEGGGRDGALDVEIHEGEDNHGGEDDADDIGEEEEKGAACDSPVESGDSHADDSKWRNEGDGDGDTGDGVAHSGVDASEGDGESGDECDGEIDERGESATHNFCAEGI